MRPPARALRDAQPLPAIGRYDRMVLPPQPTPTRRKVETVTAPTPPERAGISEALRQSYEIACLPDEITRVLHRLR